MGVPSKIPTFEKKFLSSSDDAPVCVSLDPMKPKL